MWGIFPSLKVRKGGNSAHRCLTDKLSLAGAPETGSMYPGSGKVRHDTPVP